MLGINGGELVVLLVLAFLLIGPERLPELAQQLGRLTRELKKMATGARERVREELGPEMADLAAFDPRQYDPRRIVREALMEDTPPRPTVQRPPTTRRVAGAAGGAAVVPPRAPGPAVPTQVPSAAPAGNPGAAANAAAPPDAAPNGRLGTAGATAPPAAATTVTELAEEADAEEPYVVPFDDEAT